MEKVAFRRKHGAVRGISPVRRRRVKQNRLAHRGFTLKTRDGGVFSRIPPCPRASPRQGEPDGDGFAYQSCHSHLRISPERHSPDRHSRRDIPRTGIPGRHSRTDLSPNEHSPDGHSLNGHSHTGIPKMAYPEKYPVGYPYTGENDKKAVRKPQRNPPKRILRFVSHSLSFAESTHAVSSCRRHIAAYCTAYNALRVLFRPTRGSGVRLA